MSVQNNYLVPKLRTSAMLFRDFKRFEIDLILIISSVLSVNSMYLSTDARNMSSVAHYIDDKGVKVEKQTVQAILVDSGYENKTDTDDYDWYVDATENIVENFKATTSDYRSEVKWKDDDDGDSRSDYHQENNASTNLSPNSMLDIFMALHSAWRAVEQRRQEWSKNSTMNHDPIPENETQMKETQKLRRNSKFAKNETSHKYASATNVEQSFKSAAPASETSLSEGRYIKGDPLKGYYDFVITEGSYKFWTAFQFATACLVIYSTFAAIYYSKVNPVGADYDYVQYFGGGRSFSDTNFDYEDPTDDSEKNPETEAIGRAVGNETSLWSSIKNWIPQAVQSTRTILETVDQFST